MMTLLRLQLLFTLHIRLRTKGINLIQQIWCVRRTTFYRFVFFLLQQATILTTTTTTTTTFSAHNTRRVSVNKFDPFPYTPIFSFYPIATNIIVITQKKRKEMLH